MLGEEIADHLTHFLLTSEGSYSSSRILQQLRVHAFDLAQGTHRRPPHIYIMVHTAPNNLIHLGPLPNHHADHKAKITVDDVSFWYGVKQALKHISPVATARVELSASYTIVIMTHNLQQAARIAQRTAFFHLDG